MCVVAACGISERFCNCASMLLAVALGMVYRQPDAVYGHDIAARPWQPTLGDAPGTPVLLQLFVLHTVRRRIRCRPSWRS